MPSSRSRLATSSTAGLWSELWERNAFMGIVSWVPAQKGMFGTDRATLGITKTNRAISQQLRTILLSLLTLVRPLLSALSLAISTGSHVTTDTDREKRTVFHRLARTIGGLVGGLIWVCMEVTPIGAFIFAELGIDGLLLGLVAQGLRVEHGMR